MMSRDNLEIRHPAAKHPTGRLPVQSQADILPALAFDTSSTLAQPETKKPPKLYEFQGLRRSIWREDRDLNAACCTPTPLQAPLQPRKSGTCWFWTVCSGLGFAPSFAPKIRGAKKHLLIPRVASASFTGRASTCATMMVAA